MTAFAGNLFISQITARIKKATINPNPIHNAVSIILNTISLIIPLKPIVL